jgi:hypothetical protein
MRNKYNKDVVKRISERRTKLKPSNPDVSDAEFQSYIGELKAAGHLYSRGVVTMSPSDTVDSNGGTSTIYTLKFRTKVYKIGNGEPPHFDGYLESKYDKDKSQYKIHGWLNQDGTIRLELVK